MIDQASWPPLTSQFPQRSFVGGLQLMTYRQCRTCRLVLMVALVSILPTCGYMLAQPINTRLAMIIVALIAVAVVSAIVIEILYASVEAEVARMVTEAQGKADAIERLAESVRESERIAEALYRQNSNLTGELLSAETHGGTYHGVPMEEARRRQG